MDTRELADLIIAGRQPPKGPADVSYYTGTVVSWAYPSGANQVIVNGVALNNLSVIQNGPAPRYRPKNVVLVMRKQSQYVVMGKLGGNDVISSSPPRTETDTGRITVSGTVDQWSDLPGGGGPKVLSRIKGPVVVSFGAAEVHVNNSWVQLSVETSGASNLPAGVQAGNFCTLGGDNNRDGGTTISSSIFGRFSIETGQFLGPYEFFPGDHTFSLKYRFGTINNGTGATISQPWITVEPLG